ncbi:hypothetical protein [Lactococcus formosensis]|uniref:hypothetical protein n=1 Tax=Lactococcus formosensis TaxID=1281486 RepID=UPI00254D5A27|nr:hypothetical protein [Lactococcus formosensis]
MNKINYFYPTLGGPVPTSTLRVPNNHADNLRVSVNAGLILEGMPYEYQYEIEVNGFPIVPRMTLPGFVDKTVMNNILVSMTSDFTFNDVYSNTQLNFKMKLYDQYGQEANSSETILYLTDEGA